MPLILLQTKIKASIETCFDLARNIDFHSESVKNSDEKAVAGRTSGLIELGETVTWEATHFGVRQRLTSKITAFEFPYYFTDEMVSGAFKAIKHEHIFTEEDDVTVMTDRFYFEAPLGILGKLANVLFLKRYMTNFLKNRNEYLKNIAESNTDF
ncbi:MAG: SRPBCC family protein [bacterium]